MVGRGSDTNLSHPICDPMLKRLEGPSKDRSTYWRRFCKVDIITTYHYIIVGDTYKRHTMPHEYNLTIHKNNIRLWMNTNRNSTDIHPASPGCRPGTYPLIEEAEEELNASKHRSRVMIIELTCTCNCCCSNL